MSKKTTRDADSHPTYSHRHAHPNVDHHVGPCGPTDSAGRSPHNHRRSGEKMTARVAQRIYRRYFNRDRRRGKSLAASKREAQKVAGAIIRRASRRSASAFRKRRR